MMIVMTAGPKRDLRALLNGMEPELDPDEFVYCTIPHGARTGANAVCTFQETEGETLILRRAEAEKHQLNFAFLYRKITLRVHSSLEAIGFLAAIATELAQQGISVNCVSAYYHDHLFVPADQAERALEVLRQLQRRQ
jgi:hypothetical protein